MFECMLLFSCMHNFRCLMSSPLQPQRQQVSSAFCYLSNIKAHSSHLNAQEAFEGYAVGCLKCFECFQETDRSEGGQEAEERQAGVQVRRVLWRLFELAPTPEAAAVVDTAAVEAVIQPLGLHRKRALMFKRFSQEYIADDVRCFC